MEMNYYTENQRRIINSLSEEIANQAKSCAAEQYIPRHDPDASDDFIKQRKENVAALRNVRARLEEIFTGVML